MKRASNTIFAVLVLLLLIAPASRRAQAQPYSEDHYRDLLATLYNARSSAPPLGSRPSAGRVPRQPETRGSTSNMAEPVPETPIRITGIIVDEVGRPRSDGSAGSALYAVPFRLSRRPSRLWAEAFVETWNRPPRFTSMHRPGIAQVSGDRVVLDGTTIEELEKYHGDTLKLVVERTNQIVDAAEAEARRQAEEQRRRQEANDQEVRSRASQIRFDDDKKIHRLRMKWSASTARITWRAYRWA